MSEPAPRSAADARPLTIRRCERIFRRHGLPSLIDEHSLKRDVFGRSAPFLLTVLLLELVGTMRLDWNGWQNLLAALAGLAAICAGYAVLNLIRRRPWYLLPQSIGRAELAFFVVVPAALSYVGGGWLDVISVAISNLVLLAVVRFAVGNGLFASLFWGVARIGDELASSLRRLVRLLPLVLLFSLSLFYNAEIWQVFDRISPAADYAFGMFLLAVIIVLTSVGARREAREVLADAGQSAAERHGEAHEASARALAVRAATFSPPQQRNLRVKVATTQLMQVLTVAVGTLVLFAVAGYLSITPEVRELWQIEGGSWSSIYRGDGLDLVIDQTLMRVATALAAINGLYYAINVQVDQAYREELVDDLAEEVTEVIEVREQYLALIEATPAPTR